MSNELGYKILSNHKGTKRKYFEPDIVFILNSPTNYIDYSGNNIFTDYYRDLVDGGQVVVDYVNDSVNDVKGRIKAIEEVVDMYNKMRKANVIGADKYFHCMAFCKASRAHSKDFAMDLAMARELSDNIINFHTGKNHPLTQIIDSIQDMTANLKGINCPADKTCEECCCVYKVKGL